MLGEQELVLETASPEVDKSMLVLPIECSRVSCRYRFPGLPDKLRK